MRKKRMVIMNSKRSKLKKIVVIPAKAGSESFQWFLDSRYDNDIDKVSP